MKIQIWHNILWSRYKGAVFSELYLLASKKNILVNFIQISETEQGKKALSGVDYNYHKYSYDLLFKGVYEEIPLFKKIFVLFFRALKSDADVILIPGYHYIEFWGILFAALITKKRIGLFGDSTLNDHPQNLLKGLFKRLFISCCDFYMCYGIRSRENLIHYGANKCRIFYRRQSAALPNNYNLQNAFNSRLQLRASKESPRFLYVGRLSKEKGIHILLKAFSNAKKALPLSKLILIGEGDLKSELKKNADDLSISGDVEFLGSKSEEDLYNEYSKATCLVLPSNSEPWGLVVNEALSYGCPVIASSNCGCVPELVENHDHGLVFIAGNLKDLQAKLEQAPVTFNNNKDIANSALSLIAYFTPRRAAKEILNACIQKK